MKLGRLTQNLIAPIFLIFLFACSEKIATSPHSNQTPISPEATPKIPANPPLDPASEPSAPRKSFIDSLVGPQSDDGVWINADLLKKENSPKGSMGAPSTFKTLRESGSGRSGSLGHSHRHLVFSGGPRQAAPDLSLTYPFLPEFLKEFQKNHSVSFPISLAPSLDSQSQKKAQLFFNQGILQLHGFQTLEAERSFRTALLHAPQNPMIYWGLAMANTLFWTGQPERALEFIKLAQKSENSAGPFEKELISALGLFYSNPSLSREERFFRYVNSLARLASRNDAPDEIKSFFVEAAWEMSLSGKFYLSDIGHSVESLNEIIEKILKAKPLHPIHHYKIHLWDDFSPEVVKQNSLISARDSGFSSPMVAHMWHMAGHTYANLGRLRDAQRSQEISARLDHSYATLLKVMPYEIHNYFHNNGWLVGTSIQTGQFQKATLILANLISQPHHPILNNPKAEGGKNGIRNSVFHAWMRYFDLFLQSLDAWEHLKNSTLVSFLEKQNWYSPVFESAILTRVHLELVKNNFSGAREILTQLEREYLPTKRSLDLLKESKDLTEAEISNLQSNLSAFESLAFEVSDSIEALEPGPVARRIQALHRLTKAQTAGSLFLIRSLESLNQAGAPESDLLAFRKILAERAEKLFAESTQSDSLVPVYIAHRVFSFLGDNPKASASLDRLKNYATSAQPHKIWQTVNLGSSQLSLKEKKNPKTWANPLRLSDEFLDLPAKMQPQALNLREFGPLVFEGLKLPSFEISGFSTSNSAIPNWNPLQNKKPQLLFFYLGKECVHCMEQLAKLNEEFEKFPLDKIQISAVATDSLEKLSDNLGVGHSNSSGFKFPIFSDSSLGVFRSVGAFDDFESQPLHGVFLIDSSGWIKWREIGPEPFMDFDFLRTEILRHLN